jgi:glycosyltransferase involved in cell wall biosynthesis
MRALINRVLHRRTTRFVTFTSTQRTRFAAVEGVPLDKVAVIANGIESAVMGDRNELRMEIGLPLDAFVLYLPARLAAQKNQFLAMRAFDSVARDDKRWRLVLAGRGPLETALKEEASRLATASQITFLGFRADAARLCGGMDVFLMTSRWERMPLALGEAMRAGLPVVTTPWEGAEDFVTDGITGFVAGAHSIEAFASALERLRDDKQRASIAARGREFANDQFDLDTSVYRHIALYREVAGFAQ